MPRRCRHQAERIILARLIMDVELVGQAGHPGMIRPDFVSIGGEMEFLVGMPKPGQEMRVLERRHDVEPVSRLHLGR